MAWIFEQCKDPYGSCIRQYCVFGISILVFIFCLYSICMTVKKRTHYSFQVLPLIVNTVATFSLICILSQFEQENIHLIMELIEIYSYSLLAYSYAGLYLLATKYITQQEFRKIKVVFIVFSVGILCGIVVLVVLEMLGQIHCQESHGIGNLVLSLVEVPIYALTFWFVIKTKKYIKNMEKANHQNQKSEIKLLGDEDEYISIRYKQANAAILFFTLSILVHIATVVMFFVEKTGCSEAGFLQTQSLYELIMFSLFDFATILPHIAIPIILYVIPESHYAIGNTIVIAPKKIGKENSTYSSNFADSQFQRQDLKNKILRKAIQQ